MLMQLPDWPRAAASGHHSAFSSACDFGLGVLLNSHDSDSLWIRFPCVLFVMVAAKLQGVFRNARRHAGNFSSHRQSIKPQRWCVTGEEERKAAVS